MTNNCDIQIKFHKKLWTALYEFKYTALIYLNSLLYTYYDRQINDHLFYLILEDLEKDCNE